jgi:hypothetical protein
MARDRDPDTEALGHFKLGRLIWSIGGDLEKARNHLVDFQIQCQMIKERNETVNRRYKEA